MRKRSAVGVVWLALGLATASAAPTAPAAAPEPEEAPAARVNGVAIPAGPVERELHRARLRREAEGTPTSERELAVLRGEILDRFIATELIHQAARAEGLAPSRAAVLAEFDKFRAHYADAETFERYLKQEGLSVERLEQELGRELLVRTWAEREIEPMVRVSDADLRRYYETNRRELMEPESARVRHILFRVSEADAVDQRIAARKRATLARSRLRRGEDFALVAGEVSEDPASAARGGELGVVVRGQSLPEFEAAVFELRVGELSDVIATPMGYHLIEVLERRPAAPLAFEKVEPQLRELLVAKARRDRTSERVEALRRRAKVEIYQPGSRSGALPSP